MASTAPTRVDLTSAMLEFFQDNTSAREFVTTTDDNGMVQFVPNTILQANGSRLSNVPMDRRLSLLLDVCDNSVSGEETTEDLGLVTALLAANKGGGDAALRNLRKRRTIVGRAFEFLVASTTTSGAPRSGMRRATLGDSTHLLSPSRLQMMEPTASFPIHPPSTTLYTLPLAATPPPSASVLGKHGCESDASSETGDRVDYGGAAHSHLSGLRTNFDIPKQVSQFRVRTVDIETAQSIYTNGRAHHAFTTMPFTHNSSTRTSPASTQLCHKTTCYHVPGTYIK